MAAGRDSRHRAIRARPGAQVPGAHPTLATDCPGSIVAHVNEGSRRGLLYAQSWALMHYLTFGSEAHRQLSCCGTLRTCAAAFRPRRHGAKNSVPSSRLSKKSCVIRLEAHVPGLDLHFDTTTRAAGEAKLRR